MKEGLSILAGVIYVIFLIIMAPLLNGYVLSVLWGWFIVPTFGAPMLGVVPAMGIALVVRYLTYPDNNCKEKETEYNGFTNAILRSAMVAFGPSLTALVWGWILLQFM